MAANLGTILYLKGAPAGATYTDRNGITQSVGTLSTSYQASALIYVGLGKALVVTAQGALAGGLTVSWALQVKRTDGSGVTWRWATVAVSRMFDGALGTDGVQEIAAADLVGPDGVAADIAYGTENHRASGTVRIIAKASGAPAAGDTIIFGVSVR